MVKHVKGTDSARVSKTFSSQIELSSKYLSPANFELISRNSPFRTRESYGDPSRIDVVVQVDWAAVTFLCSDSRMNAPNSTSCADAEVAMTDTVGKPDIGDVLPRL